MKINLFTSLIIFFRATNMQDNFECTSGKDPSQMSKKEYLLAFSQGACSPTVIIPALISTKLYVQILDCEKFKNDLPQIFDQCGFTHCSKKAYEIWKSVPESEYPLWFPNPLSPMSIFTAKAKRGMCLAQLISLKIDFSKPIEDSLVEHQSFRVRILGNTPGTKDKAACGDNAVINLLPFGRQSKGTKVWQFILNKLKKMGYVAGLTYQVIPYNWAKSMRNNELNHRFLPNIERLNRLTNKKVVILSQSYGNNNVYYQLLKMDKLKKQKMVKVWMAFGFPTLGSSESQANLVAGSDFLTFWKGTHGLKVEASVQFLDNTFSTFELQAIEPFDVFEGQSWFKAFTDRIAYEKGEVEYSDSGFLFLPRKEDTCSPAQYKFGPNCELRIFDSRRYPLVTIQNKSYFAKDTRQLYLDWFLNESLIKVYDHTIHDRFYELENPGVPTIPIILRTAWTVYSYNYTENIREAIKQKRFAEHTKGYTAGDATVTTNSLYAGFLKWAFEFDNKLVDGAQPVKIVDFCSVYKTRDTPYDTQSDTNELMLTKNEFFGLKCECLGDTGPENCNHSLMISDAYLIELVANTLKARENGDSEEYREYLDGLSEQYLVDYSDKCVQLKEGIIA